MSQILHYQEHKYKSGWICSIGYENYGVVVDYPLVETSWSFHMKSVKACPNVP